MQGLIMFLFMQMVLLGCANHPLIINSIEKVSKNEGVILVSVTKVSPGNVQFYYRKIGSSTEYHMQALSERFWLRKDDYASDQSRSGRLLAFKAPAGRYQLTGWDGYVLVGINYRTLASQSLNPIAFNVSAGAVTYLGNLHLETTATTNSFGMQIPIVGTAYIKNSAAIDLKLMETKFPSIFKWPIVEQSSDIGRWYL